MMWIKSGIENPSKTEVIGHCGRGEKTEWPRSTDKSRTLKKNKKWQCIMFYIIFGIIFIIFTIIIIIIDSPININVSCSSSCCHHRHYRHRSQLCDNLSKYGYIIVIIILVVVVTINIKRKPPHLLLHSSTSIWHRGHVNLDTHSLVTLGTGVLQYGPVQPPRQTQLKHGMG